MLRLSTFCLLLAVAAAQNGYEYNKPGKPFGQDVTPNRPFGRPTNNNPGTTPSYATAPQNDDYQGTTSGFPSVQTGYPSGPNQNYPGATSQRPQKGYLGQTPSYSGQGQSGSSTGFQESGNYQGQGQNYPNRPSRPGSIEFGTSGPTSPGNQPGQPQRPNYSGPSTNFGPESSAPSGGANSGFVSPGSNVGNPEDNGAYENGDYSAIPGEPDVDYPILSEVPETSFRCDAQQYPGYYADVETRCQVFHVCANNRTYDFLCPNGTIFSQQVFVCVWWNQFDCNTAPSLYELNANLYDYSTTGSNQNYFTGSNDFSQGSQGNSYPGQQGSVGSGNTAAFPGSGPSNTLLGNAGPKEPTNSYPESPEAQRPINTFPGSTGSQKPGSYPNSNGPQSQLSVYPDSSPQTPSGLYQGATSPSGFPGSSISQDSASFPGITGPQDSLSFPGSRPQSPTSSYPSNVGPQGYPGSQGSPNYQGSSGGSQGYPSGRPSGPSFPSGSSRPQGAVKPNREYLPPRN